MKKIMILAAVMFSMSFFACGSGDANAKNDSDSVAQEQAGAAAEKKADANSGSISSAEAKVFGDQASYVKVDASKPATWKISQSGDKSTIVVRVPLVLEKTLKYGPNTGLGFGLEFKAIDADGNEITLPGSWMKFELGAKDLDTGVFDELQAFMESEPGATFNMPFHISALTDKFAGVDEAIKTATTYKIVGFSFLHLD